MPQVAISADFLTAFSKIPRSQQKKVREFITRFQNDPTAHSINYESTHRVRDERVRTVRIDLAYRAIVPHPQKGAPYLLAWADHHDEAMDWARNKQFEGNPVTGAQFGQLPSTAQAKGRAGRGGCRVWFAGAA